MKLWYGGGNKLIQYFRDRSFYRDALHCSLRIIDKHDARQEYYNEINKK